MLSGFSELKFRGGRVAIRLTWRSPLTTFAASSLNKWRHSKTVFMFSGSLFKQSASGRGKPGHSFFEMQTNLNNDIWFFTYSYYSLWCGAVTYSSEQILSFILHVRLVWKKLGIPCATKLTLTLSLPCFSVQIKHKICKNMNSVQQQCKHHH